MPTIDFKPVCKCKNCRFADAEKYKVCYCNVDKHIVDAKKERECVYFERKEK